MNYYSTGEDQQQTNQPSDQDVG